MPKCIVFIKQSDVDISVYETEEAAEKYQNYSGMFRRNLPG